MKRHGRARPMTRGSDLRSKAPDGLERLPAICRLFVEVLGRLPDFRRLEELFRSDLSLADLRLQFETCEERRLIDGAVDRVRKRLALSRGPKILLFGAFGNGNLGDREMAIVIAKYLEKRFAVRVYVHSHLQESSFPVVSEDRRLQPADVPFNIKVLNLFDAMIIGGGGFLAHPHEPVWTPGWSYCVPVPYGILSNGVTNPLPAVLRRFVRDAAFASGRDPSSVEALASANPKAARVTDPILALWPLSRAIRSPGIGRVVIVRGPADVYHERLRRGLRPGDRVIGFEPHAEQSLRSHFPDIEFVTARARLQEIVDAADTVVSERFHGAIAGLLRGKRVYALRQAHHNGSKLKELFNMLKIDEFHVARLPTKSEKTFPFELVRGEIAKLRTSFAASTDLAMAELAIYPAAARTVLGRAANGG